MVGIYIPDYADVFWDYKMHIRGRWPPDNSLLEGKKLIFRIMVAV